MNRAKLAALVRDIAAAKAEWEPLPGDVAFPSAAEHAEVCARLGLSLDVPPTAARAPESAWVAQEFGFATGSATGGVA